MTRKNMPVHVSRLLLAGDIQARPVSNAHGGWVEVRNDEGGTVIWGIKDGFWSYLALDDRGKQVASGTTKLADEASPEDVASFIAQFDYDF